MIMSPTVSYSSQSKYKVLPWTEFLEEREEVQVGAFNYLVELRRAMDKYTYLSLLNHMQEKNQVSQTNGQIPLNIIPVLSRFYLTFQLTTSQIINFQQTV